MSRRAAEVRPALGMELMARPELERRWCKKGSVEPWRECPDSSAGSSSSSSSGVRLKPAAAKVAATAESCSSLCVRLRLRIAKNIQRIMEAAARPTRMKTPATAALFRRNLFEKLKENMENKIDGLTLNYFGRRCCRDSRLGWELPGSW